MKKKDIPDDLYFSPSHIIHKFQELIDYHGSDKILRGGEYKLEREAWIAAVFLLGLKNITEKDYWLRVFNEDSTPDVIAFSPVKMRDGIMAAMHNIEIFEYESHSPSDLTAAVNKKLKKKYPDHYLLLGYGHHRSGEALDPEIVFQAVKELKPNLESIWFMSSIETNDTENYVLLQLHPYKNQKSFDYLKLCRESKQKKIIKYEGKGITKGFSFYEE
ncbi:MAG: hypothetical protein ABIO02_00100 [Patescibacteria group bacterium]